jgi:hypothetical protein
MSLCCVCVCQQRLLTECCATAGLDRRILMMYYFWDVLNVFQSVVAGALFETLEQIVKDPGNIGNLLGLRALGLVPLKLIFHNAVFNQVQTCAAKIFFKCGPPSRVLLLLGP